MNNSYLIRKNGELKHPAFIFKLTINDTLFQEYLKRYSSTQVTPIKDSQLSSANKNVFIVHGHDNSFKQEVARFIEQLKLNPVILHEKPNAGKTIIEKFESHSNVGFAVVLLTPDDVGGAKIHKRTKPRARQNVILELGFFIGSLGRKNVCALYVKGVELPSDLEGLIYIPLDEGGAWKLKLGNEIKASGVAIDLNLVV
jgi:predicted nucleotide-binding protein